MMTKPAFLAFPAIDLARARAYYEQVLGLTLRSKTDSSLDFDMGGLRLRLYLQEGSHIRQHSGMLFYVEEIEAAVSDLSARGAIFRSEIRQEPWGGRVITVADLDGNLFDLVDSEYEERLINTIHS